MLEPPWTVLANVLPLLSKMAQKWGLLHGILWCLQYNVPPPVAMLRLRGDVKTHHTNEQTRAGLKALSKFHSLALTFQHGNAMDTVDGYLLDAVL